MAFRDKYPRTCPEFCPVCKRTCTNKIEKHTDDNGNLTAHICGAHWWIRLMVPTASKPFNMVIHGDLPGR